MLKSRITVLEGGLQTIILDLGRVTGKRFGVPPGGVLDRAAHLAANKLVGNHPEAATLEITLQGPRLQFDTPALISLTGANYEPLLDDRPIPRWMSVFVRAGQTLTFSRPLLKSTSGTSKNSWGRVCYLSVHGGFDAPLWMGSRSTYLKSKLGGYKGLGRGLQPGDVLESGSDVVEQLRYFHEGAGKSYPETSRPEYSGEVEIRVIRGPFDENFSEEAYFTLFNSKYTLTEQSDRMGYRLEGPRLAHKRPELAEIAACGTTLGTMQVPSSGQPIVLMADHQVTGGYPIIATALSGDLHLLAQLLPGGKVSFKEA